MAGAKNRSRGLPCQDGVFASLSPRPFLVLMDGRGSSPRSQHGVAAARAAARDALRGMEAQLALALDGPGDWVARVAWRGAALMIYAAAAWAQERAAADLGCEPREMEFTLALCAAGRRRVGWCAVGDSPVYLVKSGVAGVAHNGRTGRDRAEFANQTRFLTARGGSLEGFEAGLVDGAGVKGALLATDGAACRLERLAAHVPGGVVSGLIETCALAPPPGAAALADLLREEGWERATSDDRALAVLARAAAGGGEWEGA